MLARSRASFRSRRSDRLRQRSRHDPIDGSRETDRKTVSSKTHIPSQSFPIVHVIIVSSLPPTPRQPPLTSPHTSHLSNPSNNSISTTITNTTIPHLLDLTTPLIPHKPEPRLSPQRLQRRHDDPNGMPSADRIPRLLEHSEPLVVPAPLASAHAPEIHRLDALVDRWVRGRLVRLTQGDGFLVSRRGRRDVVGVPEAGTPVGEIGGDDKGVFGVTEVGG